MKRILLITFIFLSLNVFSQNEERIFNGYDGGMMLHVGYVSENVESVDFKADGVTKGIGGAIRFHLGQHYRIGTEGYVSTLSLKKDLAKGSYIKTFWAGLINDFYWQFGKFMPYVGLNVGGGTLTDCFIFEGNNHDWNQESSVIINKSAFVAIDPYIGCDYSLTDALHLTFKIDYLNGFNKSELYLPTGPRFYIGAIFFH
ncbi:MAG: hypothetical protein IKW54_01070 [Bacteroidales bacterium]|nr:hypothetical protein [Bacteroidales bacterium]